MRRYLEKYLRGGKRTIRWRNKEKKEKRKKREKKKEERKSKMRKKKRKSKEKSKEDFGRRIQDISWFFKRERETREKER